MTDIGLALFYAVTCLYVGGLAVAAITITYFRVAPVALPRPLKLIALGLHVGPTSGRWRVFAVRCVSGAMVLASQSIVAAMVIDPGGRLGHGLPGQIVAVAELALLGAWARDVMRTLRELPSKGLM